MSLYNRLHGFDENANMYLDWLGLTPNSFGRFRDAYLDKHGDKIIVLARIGKGSWCDNPQEILSNVTANQYFLTEYDDTFDSTFKYLHYRIPEKFAKQAQELATGIEPLTLKEKTDAAIQEINNMTPEQIRKDPRLSPIVKVLDNLADPSSNTKIIEI